MDRLGNILVATDLSPGARTGLVQGARLASVGGSTLHVLHVVKNEHARELLNLFPEGAPAVGSHLKEAARDKLDSELRETGLKDVAIDHLVVGNPIEEILKAIDRIGPDLLVIGAAGRTGRRELGTVAVRIVRKAPVKVLVVPENCTEPFTSIVACLDFSELSPTVMEQALRIARLENGGVTALHVYQMPWDRSRWGAPTVDAVRLEQEFKKLMSRRFQTDFAELSEGTNVEFRLISRPDFGAAIVDHATRTGSRLVVAGTTGRSALGYMLLGTTAEKVLRAVGCAVLAVKPPGFRLSRSAAPKEPAA
jgi:nucleotide-binding universal stress UspA family protein